MKFSIRNTFTIIISSLIATLVYLLVQNTLQLTVNRIDFRGTFPSNATVTISNIQRNGYVEKIKELTVVANEVYAQSFSTGYLKSHIYKLQINIEQESDTMMKFAWIKLYFPYLETYHFDKPSIGSEFHSEQSLPVLEHRLQGKSILIQSIDQIGKPRGFLSLLIASFFFIASFCMIRGSSWSLLPAFKDMRLEGSLASRQEFDSINGLRGLAAILVLLSHSAPGFTGGQMGLALLFVISGFLLTKPFVLDKQRIFNIGVVERYFIKRFRRILPMYYFYVFIVFGVSSNIIVTYGASVLEFDVLLRHLLFLEAGSHLWPMTQIFTFYMLLPLVLVVTGLSHRIHRTAPLLVLLVGCYFAYAQHDNWDLFFNGKGYIKFFLYAFLFGVLAAYIQYDWLNRAQPLPKVAISIIGIVALVLVVLSILWTAPMPPDYSIFYWIRKFWVKCIIAAFIILLSINSFGSLYHKIITNWLFRSVGVIGFSFYLLHGVGMTLFSEIQFLFYSDHDLIGQKSWPYMLGSFCLTYPLALFTYSFIERPFFGRQRDKGYVTQTS